MHDHDHDHHHHAPDVTARNEKVVLAGFLLTFGFMFAEIAGGLLSGSLALIADAGHMATDALALALAWLGFRLGRRAQDERRSFGYLRTEVLAALFNAVALILLTVWIVYEAAVRLADPGPVLAGPMAAVAALGLVVNCAVFWMLSRGQRDHVNIRGAMLHVLGDLLGSVAAIGAAVVIHFTGWTPIDPILSVLLSALILRSAWGLLGNSLHILMEGAPGGAAPEAVRAGVLSLPGVREVSHVHTWSISSGSSAATMSVTLTDGADPAGVVAEVKHLLAERFALSHSTIEIDWTGRDDHCPLGRHAHG